MQKDHFQMNLCVLLANLQEHSLDGKAMQK